MMSFVGRRGRRSRTGKRKDWMSTSSPRQRKNESRRYIFPRTHLCFPAWPLVDDLLERHPVAVAGEDPFNPVPLLRDSESVELLLTPEPVYRVVVKLEEIPESVEE